MVEKYTWTVDVELDWGGRTSHSEGLQKGLAMILDLFHQHQVKALFFVSTEVLRDYSDRIDLIKSAGHEIGSHGHFHMKYKDPWRAQQDMEISKQIITGFSYSNDPRFRAPKFYMQVADEPYSMRKNHVSLLKYAWSGGRLKIPTNPIFYLHPFDIIRPSTKSPSLFCKLLYARPNKAWQALQQLIEYYPGGKKLK